MSIANVLVHIGGNIRSLQGFEVAAALARIHRAHLTGLYILPRTDLPGVAHIYVGPDVIERQHTIAKQDAGEAEAAFRVRAEGEALHCDWRCEEGDVHDVVTRLSRYADVVVLGQTAPGDTGDHLFIELPEKVVLAAGRPVLVVPYVGSYFTVGERALIAWDGSREAARAVHDALPLLTRARMVAALSVDPDGAGAESGAAMAAHLAQHGVPAEASTTVDDKIGTGNVLLSRAGSLGADLIVIGAYGHSRAREWVVGGVTRHILGHMTTPVFMSH